MMDFLLSNKIAIVTGASRGIGKAIAETLSAEGMKVVLAARSRSELDALAQSLPTESLVIAVDLREPESADRVIAETIGAFGKPDLLVNNAGATQRGDFLTLSDEAWRDGFGLKFYAAMRLARAAWSHLQVSGGTIINIIGVGGRTGSAEFTIGGAVNAALMNLTKSLADRGVRDGVRVNAINPGSIATDRLQTRLRKYAREKGIDFEEASQRMPREMKISRFGDPAEIARAVAFLASPQAAYIQGVILDVDGGATRTL
ncbi:MAG TPA: SDR family oxidoreductase [Anaerolineales bacterium]|nr:SDR family oxidoreductase [Anaerolineales bacterium]